MMKLSLTDHRNCSITLSEKKYNLRSSRHRSFSNSKVYVCLQICSLDCSLVVSPQMLGRWIFNGIWKISKIGATRCSDFKAKNAPNSMSAGARTQIPYRGAHGDPPHP